MKYTGAGASRLVGGVRAGSRPRGYNGALT